MSPMTIGSAATFMPSLGPLYPDKLLPVALGCSMLPLLIPSAPNFAPCLCPPAPGYTKLGIHKRLQAGHSCLAILCPRQKEFYGLHIVSHAPRQALKAGKCGASLNARCAAEQTQTIKREAPTISRFPFQAKHTQKLDDGGSGLPPMDRGGGGGGGGGGGSPSSGGFFLFGFLLFLSFLKDKEEEDYYRRRHDYDS